MDHDGQEDKCVDNDLPFSELDDNSLVEEISDISQQQGKPTMQNDDYHQVIFFIEIVNYLQGT